MENKVTFYDLLETQVLQLLSNYLHEEINYSNMHRLRSDISKIINNVYMNSNVKPISHSAVLWLTDELFKSIKINDTTQMGEVYLMNSYTTEDLDLYDIMTLKKHLANTKLESVLESELARRLAAS